MPFAPIVKPTPDEYPAAFQAYVGPVEVSRGPELLLTQPDRLGTRLGGLSEAAALARYAPGKWSVKEVIGHLSDVERVMSYRLLRIARGDATPLPGFDENEYVAGAGFDRRPLMDLLDDFRAVRGSTATLVEGLPTQAWVRRGSMSGLPVSARALFYITVGHVEHHGRILRERYALDV